MSSPAGEESSIWPTWAVTIFREITSYGLIGFVQLLVDWFTFVALTWLGVPTAASNIISRMFAAVCGFWGNGRLTFRDSTKSKLKKSHLSKFIVSWVTLTTISTILMSVIGSLAGIKFAWLVKPIVDGALACVAFLTSKYWVYR